MTSWFNITTQIDAILASLARIEKTQKLDHATLQAMQTKENKMADVLDSIQAEETTVVSDLTALSTAVQTVITDLQALQAGNIPTSDPRFAAALSQLQSIDASIQAVTQSATAAVAPKP